MNSVPRRSREEGIEGVLQQYEPGWPLGVSYLARYRNGQRSVLCLGAACGRTYRRHPTDRWLYGGSAGPLSLSCQHQAALLMLGEAVAEQFGLVGLFNVDLLVPPDGPPVASPWVLLEINPRYSASMELLPAAGRLIDAHLLAYQELWGQCSSDTVDERLRPLQKLAFGADCEQPIAGRGCKRIIYAPCDLRFELTRERLHELGNRLSGDATVTFHDLPHPGSEHRAHCPLLTVLVREPAASLTNQRDSRPTRQNPNSTRQREIRLEKSRHSDRLSRIELRGLMQTARRAEAAVLAALG